MVSVVVVQCDVVSGGMCGASIVMLWSGLECWKKAWKAFRFVVLCDRVTSILIDTPDTPSHMLHVPACCVV